MITQMKYRWKNPKQPQDLSAVKGNVLEKT